MDYIYARVSTNHQTTDNQTVMLIKQYPDAQVVTEVESGVKQRPALEQLISTVAEGDRIIIYAIDRLGRSITNLLNIFDTLEKKKVSIVSQREGILDRSTPTGEFMLNIMASLATMERRMLVERINSGLARAKSSGKKLGRRYTHDLSTLQKAVEMRQQGVSYREAAQRLNISIGSIRAYEKIHGRGEGMAL